MQSRGIEVEGKKAQKLHVFLLDNNLLDRGKKPIGKNGLVIFPVLKIPAKKMLQLKKIAKGTKGRRIEFEQHAKNPSTLKDALASKFSKKEIEHVRGSFDLLGDCAIVEIPGELVAKQAQIGKALMSVNKSVKSVFAKTGAHAGIFRNEPVRLIAGKKTKFATYKEHGCTFRISIGEVFFSPRLSTERKRICGQIKKGEVVAALFAGVGPFPIIFAKNSQMKKAIAIELNPVAVQDMRHNIDLNKVQDRVEPILGDVSLLSKKFEGLCDRAVMPLPKGGESFLEDAIRFIKPEGGVVHYYQFADRQNPFDVPTSQIAAACKKLGRKFKVIFKRKVRDYAPDIVQVVVDFEVWE